MGYGGKQASRSGDVRRFNFTGNGSNTAFDLGFTPASPNQLIVTVNGVIQHYDAFSLTGSTMTFTGTPAAGDAIQVTAVVDAVGVTGIPDGAVANVSSLKVTTTPVLIGNAVGTFTGPLIQAASNANSWIQINAQNLNNGNNASTDLVLARSDGSDTAGFIDVGINSNTYSQAAYSIMTPNSGYMFTNGGDLVLGTQTAHNVLFHTGNTTATSEKMRIDIYGSVGIGNQTYPLKNMSGASGPMMQIGSAVLGSQGAAQTLLGSNYYINSSGTNSYIAAGKSARYMMSAGGHYWSAANTGTADAAITYATVMSQGGPGYSVALEGASSVAGVGISFPPTQVPSSDPNTLDDYEEGTWTPILTRDGNSTDRAGSYTYREAYYTKIGNVVYYTLDLTATGVNTVSGSFLSVYGLPFTSKSGSIYIVANMRDSGVLPVISSGYIYKAWVQSSSNYIYFQYDSLTNAAYAGTPLAWGSSGRLTLQGWYYT